ncbi:MAG: exopolysaccharide biosynthesis protein [Gammaproteobacteria bacterium]
MSDSPPAEEPHSLEQLVERMRASGEEHDTIDIGTVVAATGTRSFAPLLVMIGLIAVSPLSGIPTLPSVLGVIAMLTAGQLLLKRSHLWLPRVVTRRRLPRAQYCRALEVLRRPASIIDRIMRPRLTVMTRGPALYAMGVTCFLTALTMPPLELLPFVAFLAGLVLLLFGLAMLANDGVLALVAWACCAALAWLVIGPIV